MVQLIRLHVCLVPLFSMRSATLCSPSCGWLVARSRVRVMISTRSFPLHFLSLPHPSSPLSRCQSKRIPRKKLRTQTESNQCTRRCRRNILTILKLARATRSHRPKDTLQRPRRTRVSSIGCKIYCTRTHAHRKRISRTKATRPKLVQSHPFSPISMSTTKSLLPHWKTGRSIILDLGHWANYSTDMNT